MLMALQVDFDSNESANPSDVLTATRLRTVTVG
jgi:hypothetical protein